MPAITTTVSEAEAATLQDPSKQEAPKQEAPKQEAPKSEAPLIFGKYKTQEEAERGYKELEAKLGAQNAPKAEATATKLKIEESTVDARQAVEKAGLDFEALDTEYAQHGKLSDEAYQKLAAQGFTKDKVDTYIQGQQAVAREYIGNVAKVVGGEDNLKSIMQWAAANLSKEEKDAANKALASGDLTQATLVMRGVQASYTQATGVAPTLVNGGSAPVNSGPKPFANPDEMVAAMNDKRYTRDSAYIKEVERRIAVSSF